MSTQRMIYFYRRWNCTKKKHTHLQKTGFCCANYKHLVHFGNGYPILENYIHWAALSFCCFIFTNSLIWWSTNLIELQLERLYYSTFSSFILVWDITECISMYAFRLTFNDAPKIVIHYVERRTRHSDIWRKRVQHFWKYSYGLWILKQQTDLCSLFVYFAY